jgi:hypothetical protein
MTTPVNEVVADLVSRLDSNLREAFEERASIREFDGGLTRELAEASGLAGRDPAVPRRRCCRC